MLVPYGKDQPTKQRAYLYGQASIQAHRGGTYAVAICRQSPTTHQERNYPSKQKNPPCPDQSRGN